MVGTSNQWVSFRHDQWQCESWSCRRPPARTGSQRQPPARRLHSLRQRWGLWKTVGGESDHSHQVGTMGRGRRCIFEIPRVVKTTWKQETGSRRKNMVSIGCISPPGCIAWDSSHSRTELYFKLLTIQSTHLITVTLALSELGEVPIHFCFAVICWSLLSNRPSALFNNI